MMPRPGHRPPPPNKQEGGSIAHREKQKCVDPRGWQPVFVCNGPCLCCGKLAPERNHDSVSGEAAADQFWPHDMEIYFSMKRPSQTPAGPPPDPPWNDNDFKSDLPNLYVFLHDDTWDDGKVRITGSISIFKQKGALKAAVNDKDRGLVAFVTAPTFAELLTLIDMGICADNLDWKANTGYKSDKKPPY